MATFKVDTEQHGELNCWRITSERAELLIAQQGAQILSYQRVGEPPLLWLSDQAIFRQGKSVRAGVPVCWPWIGNLQRNPQAVQTMYRGEQAPAHGLARARDWQLLGIEEVGDGLRIEFELPEAQGDLPGWPQDVHSYFAVSDVCQARVEGVEGLGYIETLADWEQRQQQGPLGFAGETDRIYLATPQTLSIVDPHWQRRITLTSSGSRSAVIWNPWTERAQELADMADDGWQRMLCIETANVWDDVVELKPGATCSLSVSIGSEAI